MVIIFFIIGIFIASVGLWMRWISNRAMTWPASEGEIVESELVPDPHDAGTVMRVRYRYAVDGRVYESAQVSYAGRSSGAAANRALVERYPLGSRVTAYYNPRSPRQAVLEREPNGMWLGAVGTGLVFMVVAAVLSRK